MKKQKKKRSKAAAVIEMIIIIVAAGVFIYSAYNLISYYWTGIQAENQHEEERKLIDDDAENVRDKYYKLYLENNDFIGWISIEGTNVSYPVMFTPEDPEFYLHNNFNKEYEYAGVPFVDYRCNPDPDKGEVSDNIIIYGHNMKNDTMFSRLVDYQDEDYYREHLVINFDTLWDEGQYQLVGAIMTNAYGEEGVDGEVFKYFDSYEFATEEDFDLFMRNVEKYRLYDTGVDVEFGDRLITLSTCQYTQTNGRMAIIAKKIN